MRLLGWRGGWGGWGFLGGSVRVERWDCRGGLVEGRLWVVDG